MAGLSTQEKQDILQQFQDNLGFISSVEEAKAIAILESCDWNIEIAVSVYKNELVRDPIAHSLRGVSTRNDIIIDENGKPKRNVQTYGYAAIHSEKSTSSSSDKSAAAREDQDCVSTSLDLTRPPSFCSSNDDDPITLASNTPATEASSKKTIKKNIDDRDRYPEEFYLIGNSPDAVYTPSFDYQEQQNDKAGCNCNIM